MKAVVVAPGEGRFVAIGSAGAGVMVKASETETGGLCTVWESRIALGMVGAGAHYHRGRDEYLSSRVSIISSLCNVEANDRRAGSAIK